MSYFLDALYVKRMFVSKFITLNLDALAQIAQIKEQNEKSDLNCDSFSAL